MLRRGRRGGAAGNGVCPGGKPRACCCAGKGAGGARAHTSHLPPPDSVLRAFREANISDPRASFSPGAPAPLPTFVPLEVRAQNGHAPAERLVAFAARITGCRAATVVLAENGRLVPIAAVGMEAAWTAGVGALAAEMGEGVPFQPFGSLVAAGAAGARALHAAGVGTFVAVPIGFPDGTTLGLLATLDPHPRDDERVRSLLAELAFMAEQAVEPAFEMRRQTARIDRERMRFRALVEASAQVVWVGDDRGNVEEITRTWEGMTGQPSRNLRDWRWAEAIHPADRAALMPAWRRAIADHQPFEATFRFRQAGGGYRWCTLRAVPECDAAGAFLEYVGCIADVHEQYVAAEQIRENEHRLRVAFEAAEMGMWEWDCERQHVTCSDRVLELLGVTESTFSSEAWAALEYVHPDDRALVRAHARATGDGSFELALEHRTRYPEGGPERWVRSVSKMHRDAQGRPVRVVGTLVDVTAAKHYEAALVEAKERAEGLLRLQDTFLANMSHEIRTPLTAILGFSDLLQLDLAGEAREYAQIIGDSGRRLGEMLTSLLELAQLKAGEVSVETAAVDVGEAVRAALDPHREAAHARGLALTSRVPAPAPIVRADARALHRVLHHLVSNALKFTEKGRVAVRVDARPDEVAVRVEDTGCGISAAYLPHLFSEFRQESAGLTRQHEGTGIGLSIAHRLVFLMGGRLEVASQQGRGTTFTLTLPRVPA